MIACVHYTHNAPVAEFLYNSEVEAQGFLDKIREGLVMPVDKCIFPGLKAPFYGQMNYLIYSVE
jgi:hypothetical protein